MKTKIYDVISPEAIQIRTTVFIEEQRFKDEFDQIDNIAKHFVVFDGKIAVATCRLFEPEAHKYTIGRIAVIQRYRGKNIGSELLKTVENIVCKNKGYCIYLHAQISAKPFYVKQGYVPFGKIDYDECCPHIWMRKKLGCKACEL